MRAISGNLGTKYRPAFCRVVVIALVTLLVVLSLGTSTHAGSGLSLQTNEQMLADVRAPASLPIDDLRAMFVLVLAQLPERVTVYPTENYYYFAFFHAGLHYSGNIRLDLRDRDDGYVHFAYFEDYAPWREQSPTRYARLGADDGVRVECSARLSYRITANGRTVTFMLNDLSAVKPSAGQLADTETFIGPIFDESGVRFLLAYDRTFKAFRYVLDESDGVPDTLVPSARTPRIQIGSRTGFAFYVDHHRPRKILIGVHDHNASNNTFYDGPFDQLPDNFVAGDTLHDAMIEANPSAAGKISRLGHYGDSNDRFLIAPYALYRTVDDLMRYHHCASSREVPTEAYLGCFDSEKGSAPDR